MLVAGLLTYIGILVWPVFKILLLAILIAVALYPLVSWFTRKGFPEWAGLLVASALMVIAVAGFFILVAPLLFRQLAGLGENLPRLRDQMIEHLPRAGVLHEALQKGMTAGTVADSRLVLERVLVLVERTLGGLLNLVVVMVLAVYLMTDGPRVLKWLIVFFPLNQREKISQALVQVSHLISSYVGGQLLISALAATYLCLVLKLLGVPMALLLGIFAGVCDILPIIGFLAAVFVASAMGLAVSPATAVIVFIAYGAYHLFENFFILPRVYGKHLKLCKLAVPLAVAAGGLVAGMVGAIVALPLIAAYPVIERLWLGPKLAPDTLKAHEGESP